MKTPDDFTILMGNEYMKYKITIEETVSETFEIDADSMEEALKKAETGYNKGQYVLTPGNLTFKQMSGTCEETKESAEWVEF